MTQDYRARLVEAVRTIERLQERVKNGHGARLDEPIAVVGLGCRLPGGADGPESLWRLLRDGVDASSEFPAERADIAEFADPDPDAPGKAYTLRGGFLGRIDRFEPAVFGISPREALGMDPQQRLVLEVAWEALERAGYAPDGLTGTATGVYLGVSTTDYVRLRQSRGDIRDVDAYQLVGEPSFIAGRVSYTLGLQGPSKVIDTTCSSSLVALHEASQALRLRECDMALAGGVNLMLTPYGFVLMSKFRALSPEGRCKTFDASADGYARGEGAGVVVLKRYADALRDGDRVLATVLGSAVNHDGRSSGLTVPNPAAQQQVVRAALAQAGVDPGEVDYVEAHGTGTSLGDPIELRALEAVIGRHRAERGPLLVGSIKTNIGHLESAAGIAGFLKLVLALQHGEIPPHLHFDEPNPNVDWDRLHIEVATGRRPWPADGRRVGAVSSFGASGTNAHVVVASPPADRPRETDGATPEDGPDVLVMSARTREALTELAGAYRRRLRSGPDLTLRDVCGTTQTGRARQTHSLAVTADSLDGLADALDAHLHGEPDPRSAAVTLPVHKHRKTAWLFTGQGAQYAGMARGLTAEPAFREAFEECAARFDAVLDRPLRSVIWPREGAPTPLDDTRYTQPALFAVEYALARMWQSWGLRPAALLGHSVGEIAAACFAGVLGLDDAVALVAARAELMARLPAGGVMAAVECDEETAAAAVAPYARTVSVAAVNGPHSVVISGAAANVDAVLADLGEQGTAARRLAVSHAFHSPLLLPMLSGFRAVCEKLTYGVPAVPLISNVTGQPLGPEDIGPDYWVRHAAGTVRFHDGLSRLHADGVRTFLEVGPAPVLLGMGRRTLDGPECAWIPSLRRPPAARAAGPGTPALDDRAAVRQALGVLHLRGGFVDWGAVHGGRPHRRVPLPTTVWRGESYWFEERSAPEAEQTGTPVPGLGRRLRGAVPTYEVSLADSLWQPHARTGADGRRFLSAGAVVGAAAFAAADAFGGSWPCLEELTVAQRVPMDGDDRVLQITFAEDADGRAAFTVHSQHPGQEALGAPWLRHAQGVLRRRVPGRAHRPGDGPELDRSTYEDTAPYDTASLSIALAGTLTGTQCGDEGVLLTLAPRAGGRATGWAEPLDAAVAALSWAAGQDTACVADALIEAVCEDPARVRYAHATASGRAQDRIVGEVDFYAEDGERIGGVCALRLLPPRAAPRESTPWRRPEDLLHRVEWQPAPLPAAPERPVGESFLLLPDRGRVAERLAAELRRRGAHCVVAADGEAGPGAGDLVARWRAEARQAGCADASGRVIVATGLDAPDPRTAGGPELEEFRDRTELAATAVIQALAAGADRAQTTLSLVTRGTVAAGPGPAEVNPFGATLWGLGRVVALEHSEHWGCAVDLDPAGTDSVQVAALLDALYDAGAEDQQALRGPDRYVARLVPHRPETARAGAPGVRRSGTYLVTGAFGGIGRLLCRWLAARGAGRLVLLGRTSLPARERWDLPGHDPAVRERVALVRELEASGALVEVVGADVCDAGALSVAVEAADDDAYPLRGVVHAAGVSAPQFLRDIPLGDARDYHAVWRPKVLGGWLLHRLTEGMDLDFFLGFSSIAATWGSQHLAAYAAANAFLDGLAEYRHGLGRAALTVSWGPWDLPSGLFDDEVLSFLTAAGLRVLAAPQCLRLLGGLLADGTHPNAVVCAADWGVFKPVMEARGDRPLLRTVEVAEELPDDGPSPVLTELEDATGAEERRAAVARYLRRVLGDVLGVGEHAIAPEADVMAYGLDSLMAMDVIRRAKQDLRVSVRPSRLFERTTLDDWVRVFVTELGGPAGAAEPAAQSAGTNRPAMTEPAAIAADVELDPDIRPGAPSTGRHTGPREVLLTGATGFLGAYLLDELLAGTEASVWCLVRCSDPAEGLARVRANAECYLPWRADAARRVRVLPGDLAKPLLGLSEPEFDDLAGRVDAIYHNGALVNFSYTYEQCRAANLTGSQEILRLACRGPLTPVSHVSTYGIWGVPGDGRTVVREDDDIASAGRLVTGYVQTKWAAERLMELARERGIPVDVHRPGRVLGDSRTGACLTTHFTVRVIKGCIQLGLAPELDLEIEMTPVDFVVRSLVSLSLREHTFGETYHLVNRRRTTFRELVAAMTGRGWELKSVPVEAWWSALRDGFAERDNELHPVMDVVEEFVVGGEEAVDYDAARVERALDGAGISCPPLDRRLLDTYFDWLVRTGYLPEPPG